MKFWDSSAIVPTLIQEKQSPAALKILDEDPQMLVWVLSSVECYSAFFRRQRQRPLLEIQEFRSRLEILEHSWTEVCQLEVVRSRAERLLAVHTLRAADALQLAAAITGFEEQTRGAEIVTFDDELAIAASKEGFFVRGL